MVETDDFKYLIKTSNIRGIKFSTWKHSLAETFTLENLDAEVAANFIGGGIYRMFNAAKEVIYVGKSNDIHRRLLQHVGRRSNTSYFIDEVVKIDFYQNDDPVMQTMLEGIFIAYHTPKYNDEVKDRLKNEM